MVSCRISVINGDKTFRSKKHQLLTRRCGVNNLLSIVSQNVKKQWDLELTWNPKRW